MTQANRGMQGAIENLIDVTHMQRESIDNLTAQIAAQQVEQASAGSSIRELKGLARQTLAAIQETTVAINGHLEVAKTQAQNIAQQSQTVADLVAENRAQREEHQAQMAAITTVMTRQQAAIDQLLAQSAM